MVKSMAQFNVTVSNPDGANAGYNLTPAGGPPPHPSVKEIHPRGGIPTINTS
jgi:hypothetical protein